MEPELQWDDSDITVRSQWDRVVRPKDGSPPRTECVVELNPIGHKRVRFLFDVGGQYRALLWSEVMRDGSFMFSPRYRNPNAAVGRAVATGDKLHIDFEQAAAVEVSADAARKINFHAGGLIKAFETRSFRASLRTLGEQERLATVVFGHPLTFEPVAVNRKRDFIVPGPDAPDRNPNPFAMQLDDAGSLLLGPVRRSFPVAPNKPLYASLYVAPTGASSQVREAEMTDHVTIIQMEFTGLDGCQDLTFQWVFGFGLEGAWPDRSVVVWAADRIEEIPEIVD